MHATAIRIETHKVRARSMQRHLSKLVGATSVDEILSYSLRTARREAQEFSGLRSDVTLHTLEDANPKLYKSGKVGRPTIGLTFLPADQSGDFEVCPWSTAGCRSACLATSGRGRFDSVQDGRRWKTLFLAANPVAFLRIAFAEVDSFALRLAAADVRGAWRGNILSDIDWTKAAPALIEYVVARLGADAPYDYTKDVSRFQVRATDTPAILAYRANLTFSASESTSDEYLISLLSSGTVPRVAIVFASRVRDRSAVRPSVWHGFSVANADTHDYRPADGTGVVSGLLAKDVATCSFAAGVTSGFFRTF